MLTGNSTQGFEAMLNSSSLVTSAVALVIYAIIIAIVIFLFSYLFGWFERKLIAKAQYRHGPTYVGKYGLLQNLADLVKLLSKEIVVPANANRFLIGIAPALLVALNVFLIFLLPFSPTLQATNFGLGLLLIFVLLGFTPILLFITAFSSGNKFADISAQRSVLLLISYELPLILVIAAMVIATGSYSISAIVTAQSHLPFAILMPLGLFIFFIAMLAELERPPFDLREADSELIAGWLTDISAPYYALSLLLDYTRVFLGSLLIALLFFGGWLGPSILPGVVWLLIKAVLIAFFITIIRIAAMRMRIDKILRFGWIWLLPLALINLIIAFLVFGSGVL
jgi:NADH-quinone oxidoreductase subunit H